MNTLKFILNNRVTEWIPFRLVVLSSGEWFYFSHLLGIQIIFRTSIIRHVYLRISYGIIKVASHARMDKYQITEEIYIVCIVSIDTLITGDPAYKLKFYNI